MKFVSRGHEKPVKIAIYTIALVTTLAYIVYRYAFTLPFNLGFFDITFGLIVILAETIEAAEFFVYYLNVLCADKRSPKTPKIKESEYPDVDVFVATINEDRELLEKTLAACANMKYPSRRKVHLYLCDDGNRKELKGLARKYKAEYLARGKHKGAKAGNYNYALSKSNSPYVAIFDADMCPSENFLLKTVPFFVKYEKVGFVQTPQSFNNPDIFQARLGAKIPFEQDYFYHYIQLARNNTNSVIMCGTNCVLARKALESIGGFADRSIAEDVATGMLMESHGYSGIAINDVLAHGEAVSDLGAFIRQRTRWGRGCIQTIKYYGVFRNRGLKFRQKLDYFVAINYWQFGVKRMLYLLLPLLFAYFGIIAIKGDLLIFISIFALQYFVKRFMIDWLENGRKSSTWTMIYELIQAPLLAGAMIKETLGLSEDQFTVTPKGVTTKKGATDRKLFACHALLFAMSVLGIVLSVHKMQILGMELYIVPLVWLSFSSIYLAIAMLFDLRKNREYKRFVPNKISRYRFSAFFSILWRGKK